MTTPQIRVSVVSVTLKDGWYVVPCLATDGEFETTITLFPNSESANLEDIEKWLLDTVVNVYKQKREIHRFKLTLEGMIGKEFIADEQGASH